MVSPDTPRRLLDSSAKNRFFTLRFLRLCPDVWGVGCDSRTWAPVLLTSGWLACSKLSELTPLGPFAVASCLRTLSRRRATDSFWSLIFLS
jgi:hypothetical protein